VTPVQSTGDGISEVELGDEELLRYSRQILLPEIGIEGQQHLRRARVLVVGIGGLGSPVAMYLAAAGIGHLVLVDHDRVDLSNLQRQIVHSNADIGRHKVASAADRLRRLNPHCRIDTLDHALTANELTRQADAADLLVDCSDNFATRFALNSASLASGTPLVSGAAIRWEGQISVFPGRAGGPCYRCLYPDAGEEDTSCSANGVAAPVVGVIGALQALETLKLLCGIGETLNGRLLLFDGLTQQWRTLRLGADPHCPACGSEA
jgi:adenylyltransferase/sulfurtransferase